MKIRYHIPDVILYTVVPIGIFAGVIGGTAYVVNRLAETHGVPRTQQTSPLEVAADAYQPSPGEEILRAQQQALDALCNLGIYWSNSSSQENQRSHQKQCASRKRDGVEYTKEVDLFCYHMSQWERAVGDGPYKWDFLKVRREADQKGIYCKQDHF